MARRSEDGLLNLAEKGDVQGLERFLRKHKGLSVNCISKDGRWSPLVKAVWAGELPAVQWLIEHAHADVDFAPPKYGITALHQAAMNNHTDIARWLLEFGNASPNTVSVNRGSTPLITAASKGYLEIVKMLVEKNPTNIQFTNKYGEYTAARDAAREGHVDVLRHLLVSGLISGDNAWPIKGKDTTPLINAIRSKEYDNRIVFCLINEGNANVNTPCTDDKTNDTPLHIACAMGSLRIVRELVKHGAHLEATNAFGETPLFCACRAKKHENIVRYLIHEAGANVNAQRSDGSTPLLFAIQSFYRNDLVEWYGHEVEVLCQTRYLFSHHFSFLRYSKIRHSLLQPNDIDLEIIDSRGATALMCACEKRNENAIVGLIKAGARVDVVHESLGTALHVACSKIYASILPVQCLIENGKADANAIRPRDGFTPLMIACQRRSLNLNTCEYLIQNARVNLLTRDKEGRSARDLAEGCDELVNLFVRQEQFYQKHWDLVQSCVHNGWLNPRQTS